MLGRFESLVLKAELNPKVRVDSSVLHKMRTSVLKQWLHQGGERATASAVGLLEKLHMLEVAEPPHYRAVIDMLTLRPGWR